MAPECEWVAPEFERVASEGELVTCECKRVTPDCEEPMCIEVSLTLYYVHAGAQLT